MEEIFTFGLIGGIWMGCFMKNMVIEWCLMHIVKQKPNYRLFSKKGIGIGGQLNLRIWQKYKAGCHWWNRGEGCAEMGDFQVWEIYKFRDMGNTERQTNANGMVEVDLVSSSYSKASFCIMVGYEGQQGTSY